ncbi:MAG: YkgJ family cysteine cluster protein, partial [Pseudomonadota bacterium]
MSSSRGSERRFACTGCGQCCTGRGSYVIEVSRREQERIRRFLGIGRDWLRRRYVFRFDDERESVRMHANGDCVFLDAGRRCRIYAVRPAQCRSYPFWPELARRPAGRAP